MATDTIFMPASEAATHLSVSKARVYQLVAAGLLPAVKRGRRTLIPRQAFDAYIAQVSRQALANLRDSHPGGADRA